MMKKTKTFIFRMDWKECGKQCVEVPVDFTLRGQKAPTS